MVAAIAEQPNWTWFFKLSGPIGNLDELYDAWGRFLDTVRFQDGEPTWTLPENWSSAGLQDRAMPGGASMRIANIATSDEEVTVSVTSMPGGQQLLPNVNRWRGQLGLRPTTAIKLASQLATTANDEIEFRIFDASGPQLTTRMGGAPFARGPAGTPAPRPDSNTPDEKQPPVDESNTRIEFDAPTQWEPGETSATVLGRWTRETDDGPAEMLLIKMNPSPESWKMNIDMWSQQISSEVAPHESEVVVAGKDARQVRIPGSRSKQADNSVVLAVMFANDSGDGYVLKLSGAEAACDRAEGDFRSLLDSIRFIESDG